MEYNGSDRRKPLAGITRQTFMTNAKEVFGDQSMGFWGMFYDMQRCTDSKVQLANEKIDGIVGQCACRLDGCRNEFIRKVSDKIPISWPSLIGILCFLSFLAGISILDAAGKIDIIGFLKLLLA